MRLTTQRDTPTTPATDSEILAFCAYLQDLTNKYFALHYDRLTPPTVAPDFGGRKYIRITRDRSAHCFVERATGLIWKAASWKAPALNFPRGNIRERNFAGAQGVYGF